MAQAVASDLWHTSSGARFVDPGQHRGGMDFYDRTGLILDGTERIEERVDHGNIPAAGDILCGGLLDKLVVCIGHHGSTDTDPAVLQVYIAAVPIKRRDLRSTQ